MVNPVKNSTTNTLQNTWDLSDIQKWWSFFLIILLLFGAKKLPQLARGVGKSMGEFKKAKDEF